MTEIKKEPLSNDNDSTNDDVQFISTTSTRNYFNMSPKKWILIVSSLAQQQRKERFWNDQSSSSKVEVCDNTENQ